MFCANCGKPIPDDSKFCVECGAPVTPQVAVPGQPEVTPAAQQMNPVQPEVTPAAQPVNPAQQEAAPVSHDLLGDQAMEQKKKSHKGFFIGVIAAAVALVIIGVLATVLRGGRGKEDLSVLYLKDGAVCRYDGRSSSVQLTPEDTMFVGELDEWRSYIYNMDHIAYDPSGKYVVFLSSDSKNTLYYQDVTGNGDPEKIDTNVTAFYSTDSAIYYRTDNLELYVVTDPTEKPSRIARHVTSNPLNADGEKVFYLDSDDDLFVYDLKSDESTQIAEGVSDLWTYGESYDFICYETLDGDLYEFKNGEPKLIAENASVQRTGVISSNEIYYYRKGRSFDLYDLVDDPDRETDAAMEEPDREDFKKTETFFGYEFETYDYDAYNAATQAYREKTGRDSVREMLDHMNEEYVLIGDFCRYDGKEETVIAENVAATGNRIPTTGRTNLSTIAIITPVDEDVSPVALSDLAELSYADSDALGTYFFEQLFQETYDVQMYYDGALYPLDYVRKDYYVLDAANNNLYHVELKDDGSAKRLERASLKDGTVGEFETVDSKFGKERLYGLPCLSAEGSFYYLKDYSYETRKGDFCRDGEVLVEDVFLGGYRIRTDTKKKICIDEVLVGSDVDKNGAFTVGKIKNGKYEEYTDDVRAYGMAEDGAVLVIRDFDDKYGGDLVRITAPGKETEIDRDVYFFQGCGWYFREL